MTAQPETDQVPDYYRDQLTEKWIDGWPVVSSYLTQIRLSHIDIKQSTNYQNRANVHPDPEHVDRIATWLASDNRLQSQPIVVRQQGNGSYVVADGNHRTAAHIKAKREYIYAYVVQTDIETFRKMALAANFRNAKSLTPEETSRQVVDLIKGGETQASAAQQAGITLDQVSRIIKEARGEDRLREAGVTAAHLLSQRAKMSAGRLDVEHLQAIGADVLKRVNGPEMESMTRKILAAKPSTQLEVARQASVNLSQEWAQAATPKGQARKKSASWTEARVVGQINKVTDVMISRPEWVKSKEVRVAVSQLAELFQ